MTLLTIAVTILASACALVCAALVFLLALQVVSALFGARPLGPVTTSRGRSAVLVPAHDEEAGIVATLETLLPQCQAGDRVIVIADNCSDKTATVAHAAGAEVIVRNNLERRGKGYALDFGINHLRADPPDVVVVVDADCQVGPAFLPAIGAACQASMRPIQALYLMHAAPDAGLTMRIAAFAWILKNLVRPLGCQVLGLPCYLTGTGMAFPWGAIRDARLATGNITEDMQLGLELTMGGFPPRFHWEIEVTSKFPDSEAGAASQRARWEHGHLDTIVHTFPLVFKLGWQRREPRLLCMALDLAIPPVAFFALMLGSTLLLCAFLAAAGLAWFPFYVAAAAVLTFAAAIFLAWFGWGRQVVSFADLLRVPIYVAAKLPLYLRFWTNRQKAWIRTDRK